MRMRKTLAIIPARLKSQRFPKKPLVKICGREMILRTVDQVRKCPSINEVWVASDSQEILDIVQENSNSKFVKGVFTDVCCKTGTDRIVNALVKQGYSQTQSKTSFPWESIINVQGDEPFISSAALEKCLDQFYDDDSADMATIVTPMSQSNYSNEDFLTKIFDPNIVKCKFNMNTTGYAINFSRKPFYQVAKSHHIAKDICEFQHIGVYVYQPSRLYEFARLPSQNNPHSLENIENLEQLRAVEAGWNIRVVEVQGPHANGVDTYQQYIALQQEMIKSFIKAQQNSVAKNIDLEKGNCLR